MYDKGYTSVNDLIEAEGLELTKRFTFNWYGA